MKRDPRRRSGHCRAGLCVLVIVAALALPSRTQSQPGAEASKTKDATPSSYDQIAPVLLGKESFQAVMARDKADKESVMARQKKLLEERYDLTPRPDGKVTMSRGKPIQVGPTAKLPEGMTWEQLAAMSATRSVTRDCFPRGFCPCRTPSTRPGAWSFPRWRSSCCLAWSASTSISTCPSTSYPSSRRPSS